MAEWLKAHAWKACIRETVSWVRIPLSPPEFLGRMFRRSRKTPPKRSLDGPPVPAPGFLNSGMSFANSFQGARVAGSQTIQQYGNALTIGPKAFNSTDPNYLNNLKARYNQVIALGGC